MKCCICGEEIVEGNKSMEHIIHNAIGGVLKSDNIYCKKCNSSYGADADKAFTKMFAPIVAGLDMHLDRETSKTYQGTMCDAEGNLYNVRFKDRKVTSMIDTNGKYCKWERGRYQLVEVDFKLDDAAYRRGLAKIAFNFAIYSGIKADTLNILFDRNSRKLVDRPIVIPFLPLTLFDKYMEEQDTNELFHVLRLFNCKQYLYVYIELFSTFQAYVLLSDNYSGNIHNDYCQTVNKNHSEEEKDEILESLKIRDYKDADIIATQYQININSLIQDLKKYHNYDSLDKDKRLAMVFEQIQKKAYTSIRKKSYERLYSEMLYEKFSSVDFVKKMKELSIEENLKFYQEFQNYTNYETSDVNTARYKIALYINDNKAYSYPEELWANIQKNLSEYQKYGHFKFNLLIKHLKYD